MGFVDHAAVVVVVEVGGGPKHGWERVLVYWDGSGRVYSSTSLLTSKGLQHLYAHNGVMRVHFR